jgi:uncharacterized membrane protein YfhO
MVYLDGVYTPVTTVNDTFMGVYVEEGEHTIRLVYPEMSLWDMYKPTVKLVCVCIGILLLGTVCNCWKRK